MRPLRLCGGGGQKRSVQQDDCRPRGAEGVNGSVHCLMTFYVNTNDLFGYFAYLSSKENLILYLDWLIIRELYLNLQP